MSTLTFGTWTRRLWGTSGGVPWAAAVDRGLRKALHAMAGRASARRLEADLAQLDDRLLRDIGLTRAQIPHLAYLEQRDSGGIE
ncbi:MAG: DUF1127 domain-containing protein [Hyphomicrobiaceae bacterium]